MYGMGQRAIGVVLVLLIVASFALGCSRVPAASVPAGRAEFRVTSLDVVPAQVAAGRSSNVTVIVTNNGTIEGTYAVALRVNGALLETQEATISPGSERAVGFMVREDLPGTYELSVEATVVTLVVTPGATAEETATPSPSTVVEPTVTTPSPTASPTALPSPVVTETVTVAPSPSVTINASDTWQLSGRLYLLTSQGITNDTSTHLTSLGFTSGLLGGSLSYIYSKLGTYWNEIRISNTILLFNASSETTDTLAAWPEEYREVCPFTIEELKGIDLPFALLKRGSGGLIRTIIVVDSSSEVASFVDAMNDQPVPVGVPWALGSTLVNATQGGGGLKENLKLGDADFQVFYPEGYEADASNMLTWANQVVGKLQTWFPDFLGVIDNRVTINLSAAGDPGHAFADTTNFSINYVTPSVAVALSDYYDTNYYVGNIAHELGHLFLEKCRIEAGGYKRADCPGWFGEGFSEYLKFLVLGQPVFDTKYSWYLPEIDNILAGGLAGITNVYPGGAWVLRFMDSAFGIGTIKAIINSPALTFWTAVTQETGLTQPQFEDQLKTWLRNRS